MNETKDEVSRVLLFFFFFFMPSKIFPRDDYLCVLGIYSIHRLERYSNLFR